MERGPGDGRRGEEGKRKGKVKGIKMYYVHVPTPARNVDIIHCTCVLNK